MIRSFSFLSTFSSAFVIAIILAGIFSPFSLQANHEPGHTDTPTTSNTQVSPAGTGGGTGSGPGSLQGDDKVAKTPSDPAFDCGLGTLVSCLIAWSGYLIFSLAAFFMGIAGILLNTVMFFSLQNATYDLSFIGTAWASLRDIANMAFIFVLLYIAVGTILQLEGIDWKKMVVKVVVSALLINFSLFFVKIIIDASHIGALIFYNAIDGEITQESGLSLNGIGTSGMKDISAAFVSAFNPQSILSPEVVTLLGRDIKGAVAMFIIYFLGSMIVGYSAYLFTKVVFLLIGRIAMLWFHMVTSPLPFVMRLIKNTESSGEKWWSSLTDNAFMIVVFYFYIYLILGIVGAFGVQGGAEPVSIDQITQGSDWDTLVPIIVQMVFAFLVTVILLQRAMSATESMAGELGKTMTSYGLKGVGMLAGGAAGFMARNTVGRLGRAYSDSRFGKDFAANSIVGQTISKGARMASEGSFDVRGINTVREAGFGGGSGVGGYRKDIDTRVANREKFKRMLEAGPGGEERAKQYDERIRGYASTPHITTALDMITLGAAGNISGVTGDIAYTEKKEEGDAVKKEKEAATKAKAKKERAEAREKLKSKTEEVEEKKKQAEFLKERKKQSPGENPDLDKRAKDLEEEIAELNIEIAGLKDKAQGKEKKEKGVTKEDLNKLREDLKPKE